MSILKSFVLIVSILVLEGCQKLNRSKNLLTVFDLKYSAKTTQAKLSELGVTGIQYIPLQTDTNLLISRIHKLKTTDNSFIICDYQGAIFQFKLNGSFINYIGSIGRGPGEYQFPSDFTIDNYSQCVYILPLMREAELYIYNLDGKFRNNIPCPKYTRKIEYLDGGLLICWRDNLGGKLDFTNTLVLIDNKGNIIKEFPDKFKYRNDKYPNGFLEEFLIYKINGNLYVKEIFSDTIFIFDRDKLDFKPTHLLDHGGTTITVKVRQNINSHATLMDVNHQYSKEINLFEFGKYIYSEFTYHDKAYSFIGSSDGRFKFFTDTDVGVINDIDGGPNIRFKSIKDENTVISWINAFELKAHVASQAFKNSNPRYPEKKKELEKLANNLKENDNPVLMLVRLKKEE
jgi:hypothetical protein